MVTSQIRQEATTPEPVLCPTDSFPAVIPVLSLMKVKSGCFSKQKLFLERVTEGEQEKCLAAEKI